MFYSHFILAKKGPLATIWIAAHLERKLRKNQITETNISDSVDSILYPEVPIALRLSGHLLLGVVRIYSRKVNLLFNDCSEALLKIHQAFQSSAVDLPPGAVVAPFNSITLPESFDFDDLEAHLSRENAAARLGGNRTEFEHHVTARDLITLREQNDDRQSLFTLDERFEDSGNPYAVLDLSIEELTPQKPAFPNAVSSRSHVQEMSVEDDVLPPLPMDDDMDFEGMDVDREKAVPSSNFDNNLLNENLGPEMGELGEGSSPFPGTTMEVPDVEKLRAVNEVGEEEHLMGLMDLDMHREASETMDVDDGFQSIKKGVDVGASVQKLEETPILREEPTSLAYRSSPIRSPVASFEDRHILGSILGKRTPKLDVMPTPVSAKREGRKRKQVFDGIMALSSVAMKKQLKSTSDICRARRKAPSTEYEIWISQRDNHVEQKLSAPSAPGLCKNLKDVFHCVINKKFGHLSKELRTDQAAGRLDVDPKEGVDDLRAMAVTEPGLEEAQNEAVTSGRRLGAPFIVGDSTKKAEAQPAQFLSPNPQLAIDQAQPEEPLSPDPQLPFDQVPPMDDTGELENSVIEQNEGAPEMEHIESTTVMETRETENEDVASVDDPVTHQPVVYEGLAFLSDSRDTDEPANKADDSGWSSRSRAVALYLKEKFEAMETAKNQNPSLNLRRLLTGRTRRESARMFFETLVLGTKGYLQVQQDGSYADIYLLASQRLLKAIF